MKRHSRRARARRSHFVFATLAMGWWTLLAGCVEPERREFRNLIVIMVDTLRSDHLPSYGYERMTAPFLTELADGGIQLQGVSAAPWTKPSIATLMTGLHPQRHQAIDQADRLPGSVPYLPAELAAHGFATRGFVSNTHVSPDFGFDRGYDEYLRGWDNASGIDGAGFRSAAESTEDPGKINARWVTAMGLHLAEDLRSPYLLYLHYLDPHDPYQPATDWAGRSGGFLQPQELERGQTVGTPEIASRLIDQYDSAILEMDAEIERLLSEFERAGLLDGTLVVVTSDHGEEFYERGNLTHGKTLHAESLAVPMIFWARDGLEAARTEARFHQVDFVPTVLSALGLPAPPDLDGTSRWAAIDSRQYVAPKESLHSVDLGPYAGLSLIQGHRKLIHQALPARRVGGPPPTNLLYSLTDDPEEHDNLVENRDEREALLRRAVALHNDLGTRSVAIEVTAVGQETRQELAALGYLETSDQRVEGRPRKLPPRLRYFDSRLHGLFAGSARDQLQSRLDLLQPSSQLLDGWDHPGPRGSRSGPLADFVLARPQEATTLVLAGQLRDRRPLVTCLVSLDNGPPRAFETSRGDFEWSLELPAERAPNGLLYVDLAISPTRTPKGRERGLLWKSLELR